MKAYKLLDNPNQKLTIDVRGTDIIFEIFQNTTSDYWYMNMKLPDGTIIILGDKMVSGIDIGTKTKYKGLYVAKSIDNLLTVESIDPSAEGLTDYYLITLDEDELDTVVRPKTPDPTYIVTDGGSPLVDDVGNYLVAD